LSEGGALRGGVALMAWRRGEEGRRRVTQKKTTPNITVLFHTSLLVNIGIFILIYVAVFI
jgi:hypothetical protein